MLLILKINDISIKNIIFCEPINNTVIDNSKFIRFIYSDTYLSMNGIYLKSNLNMGGLEANFNKFKCYFNIEENRSVINKLNEIEANILSKYNTVKSPSYKLKDSLSKGQLKIYNENYDRYNKSKNLYNKNTEDEKKHEDNQKHEDNKKTDKSDPNIILKISGLWVDEFEYGLTFKFLTIN